MNKNFTDSSENDNDENMDEGPEARMNDESEELDDQERRGRMNEESEERDGQGRDKPGVNFINIPLAVYARSDSAKRKKDRQVVSLFLRFLYLLAQNLLMQC